MTRAAWAWAAAASCLLVVGNGCSHPAPYAPNYGYPSYPVAPGAYPGAPGAYPAAPGGSYVVPGGAVPGTLGAPSSSYPGGTGPTLAPPINGGSSGGDAAPYTFDPNSPSGTVPNYEDPTTNDFGGQPGTPDDGFRQPQGNGAGASPFYPSSSAVPQRRSVEQASLAPAAQAPDYLAGVDEYDATQKITPVGFETTADFGADPAVVSADGAAAKHGDAAGQNVASHDAVSGDGSGSDGFDYEHSQYRWLRGVIDFDPVHRNWHIIYGLTPNRADKFAGSLVLLDEGQLADFQDNDVVLVQGHLDPQAGQDVLGKPYYRVTQAELLGRFE